MFQCLFNLEQYGDWFVKKLRWQVQEVNVRKNEMFVEQFGFGEVSLEVVEQVEQVFE